MNSALFVLALYFLPGIIAAGRRHHNGAAILALNLLLGWTIIGWFLAFIWALTSPPRPRVIVVRRS